MNTNKITLSFEDQTLPSLAGYDYGKKIYHEQVEPVIDFNADKIVIKFPDYKKRIASSFVEGFFSEMIKVIGLDGINTKVEIQSPHRNITDIVQKCLE